jgi:hydrogenase expression/formation protein HypC
MCLAIPGQIVSISGDEPLLRSGLINFSGVTRKISLAYLPEANVDDYVIVHAGFAIAIIDQDEAEASLQAFADLDNLEAKQ